MSRAVRGKVTKAPRPASARRTTLCIRADMDGLAAGHPHVPLRGRDGEFLLPASDTDNTVAPETAPPPSKGRGTRTAKTRTMCHTSYYYDRKPNQSHFLGPTVFRSIENLNGTLISCKKKRDGAPVSNILALSRRSSLGIKPPKVSNYSFFLTLRTNHDPLKAKIQVHRGREKRALLFIMTHI